MRGEKIKFGILSVILLAMLTVARSDDEKNKYTTKYDNIDVDTIINSPRLLKNYVDCVLEKGRCTSEGNELKKNVPDAIQTDCNKCSEKQKQLTDKVLGYLIDNEPEFWKSLQEKYDPTGAYTKKYQISKKV